MPDLNQSIADVLRQVKIHVAFARWLETLKRRPSASATALKGPVCVGQLPCVSGYEMKKVRQ